MKKNKHFLTLLITVVTFLLSSMLNAQENTKPDEIIFAWGGDINLKFVEYVGGLTGKENPKICYLPTASGDHPNNIKYWKSICKTLNLEEHILKVWVSASAKNKSFEEQLLSVDAIVVGGGNTLNMLGIWKAQGIDVVLKKALKKGIVLSGGSAGSICWFENGVSDSRPTRLSLVKGLGFLPYSNCPHYAEKPRKELYHQLLSEGKMTKGYATDDLSGVLFKNGNAIASVSQSDVHHSYFIEHKEKVIVNKMKSEILVRPNAISKEDFKNKNIDKKLEKINVSIENPVGAYTKQIHTTRLNKKGLTKEKRQEILNINISKVFNYKNQIVGVVNDAYLDSFGYTVWYFYHCNGTWRSMGEDIGGKTFIESEIAFREKAMSILKKAKEKYINCKN